MEVSLEKTNDEVVEDGVEKLVFKESTRHCRISALERRVKHWKERLQDFWV